MCIVIDINAMAAMLNPSDSDHDKYRPVFDWIQHGEGKIVYGGEKYREELAGLRKYLGILRELKNRRKTVEIPDAAVDKEHRRIDAAFQHRDFDDPHIVAIVIVSRCRLVCSGDVRSFPFLKEQHPHVKGKGLYPSGCKPPKIYQDRRHSDLLNSRNCAPCCR